MQTESGITFALTNWRAASCSFIEKSRPFGRLFVPKELPDICLSRFHLTPASSLKTSKATGIIESGKSYEDVWCAVTLPAPTLKYAPFVALVK